MRIVELKSLSGSDEDKNSGSVENSDPDEITQCLAYTRNMVWKFDIFSNAMGMLVVGYEREIVKLMGKMKYREVGHMVAETRSKAPPVTA